jgi:iron complex outermembrane receptor protein
MVARFNSWGFVVASTSIALLGLLGSTASAQQNAGSSTANSDLPPVVVNAPKSRSVTSAPSNSRRAASSGASRRSSRTARIATAPGKPVRNTQNVQRGQDPRGPINGYVAERSLTGMKTDTPLMETPQAISVIGREEIRDQNPNSLAEALRYAPGVRSETFGADTRNDWFKIRGFDAQDVGLFADGL